MHDFVQTSLPYSESHSDGMRDIIHFGIINLIVILFLIILVALFKRKGILDKKDWILGVITIIVLVIAAIVGVISSFNEYRKHNYNHVVVYQGVFKVERSGVTSDYKMTVEEALTEKPKIIVKDKKGNHKAIEVSKKQKFNKGDKVVVKVKGLGNAKPSLNKISGQKGHLKNNFELISVKRADKFQPQNE